LLCNGQAVSRSTYAELFAVITTTFGAGDNSTTFNLPDYRNRMPVGAGTLYGVGSSGGNKDAIVVSHTHTATVNDPGHNHQTGVITVDSGGFGLTARSSATTATPTSSSFTNVSVSISSTGSSGTDANMPPYLGIQFIIKT
jgi:microcystin-dependent protein